LLSLCLYFQEIFIWHSRQIMTPEIFFCFGCLPQKLMAVGSLLPC
jgi:hypothetical protein